MKKAFRKISIVLLVSAFIFNLLPAMHSLAQTNDTLIVTSFTVQSVQNALYKEFSDTYVLGTKSTMEIKITTKEKILGTTLGDDQRFTLVYPGFAGAEEDKYSVFAKFDRMEGNNTLIFKVICGEMAKSSAATIDRDLSLNSGGFNYEAHMQTDEGIPYTQERTARNFNLGALSSIPKFTFRNEWPAVKISPEPDDVSTGKISNGLSVDSIIVEIHDKILDPSDFQIRYQLWDLSQTNVEVTSEWITCSERTFIQVPVEYRNKQVGLFLEVKDVLGNYRPYNYTYMKKLSGGYSKMEYVQSNILAGSRGEFIEGLGPTSEWFTTEDRIQFIKSAKEKFINLGLADHSQYKRIFEKDLAVFIFAPQYDPSTGYTKTRQDIDIENCGFQWSTDKNSPDPSRPFQTFDEDHIIPSVELTGWGYREGYWCIIDNNNDGIKSDGTYYLHLRIADKVSQGVKWETIYYPGDAWSQVKFLRDNTPPKITFSQDVVKEHGIVTVTLEDTTLGVGNIQVRATTASGDPERSDLVPYYDAFPDPYPFVQWIITKTEKTDNDATVTIKINISELYYKFIAGHEITEEFYLHVRSKDKGDNSSYSSKSIKLGNSGIVPPDASPDCQISYSPAGPTNKPVTATITLPEGCKLINNNNSNTYTFYENGSFTFKVRDSGGAEFDYAATVENIDLTPPVIILNGPRTYPIYQGLAFDFVEPGYSANDGKDKDGKDVDLTSKVEVTSNVNVYKGGYYEVVYTVADSAGNTAREVRGVSVYETNGINIFINDVRVRGGETLKAGTLNFKFIGLNSEKYTFLYLPGKQKLGVFKTGGTPVLNNTVNLPTPGWYTFYVQDEERSTTVVPVQLN